ncbi:MAG: glutathione S-transferase [Gammaproteobacteria bacterium]|nr:glutathione S-transferase [Gammaproteobacteria bacterium]
MLTVHHLETSRSQRILWLLEELGVPYELKIYRRNPVTRLAPPELKQVHPLGKSPVISDDGEVIAESGAIIEYLAEKYTSRATGDLAGLQPSPGSPEHRQCRFWMHYAEGSLMSWLLMKLVFTTIPNRPMPFFARPIARGLCAKVLEQLVDPNLGTASDFMEEHLGRHRWFAGDGLSIADFQMSYPVEALLTRAADPGRYPKIAEYCARIKARPAYQRAEAKGGPAIPTF